MAKDIFRADMSVCEPTDAMGRDFSAGEWQLTDYETVEGVKGVMASAFPEYTCPELTLPLEADGLFKIYLGINYTKTHHRGFPSYGQLEVKLTDDDGFHRVGSEPIDAKSDGIPSKMGVKNDMYKSIQEAYWKTAEVKGRSLIIRQPLEPFGPLEHPGISNLSYVRLVPLTEEEEKEWKEEQPREDTGRVAFIYCTGHLSGHAAGTLTYHPTDPDWFEHEIIPHINSDVKVFIFEAHRGDFCCYPSKIGHFGTKENKWQDDWADPLEHFVRIGHRHGIKVFTAMRLFGMQYPMNLAPIAWAKYYSRMSEFAKKDKNGVPLTGLSLAYPEVRGFWLSLLRETLAYDIDGIQMHLNRANPFVYYEKPTVDSFIEKHGIDPRELEEDDPRWKEHSAGYVTQFLKEIRLAVDEKPGRELGVTIYGAAHKYDPKPAGYHPMRYGCDVETWISEKIINYLTPSPVVDLDQLRGWRKLAGDDVHIWPDLMPRDQPAESYAALAEKYYDAGADGVTIWDGERRTKRISEWAAVRCLGHRELLPRLKEKGPSFYRRVKLEKLGGFSAAESFHDG